MEEDHKTRGPQPTQFDTGLTKKSSSPTARNRTSINGYTNYMCNAHCNVTVYGSIYKILLIYK